MLWGAYSATSDLTWLLTTRSLTCKTNCIRISAVEEHWPRWAPTIWTNSEVQSLTRPCHLTKLFSRPLNSQKPWTPTPYSMSSVATSKWRSFCLSWSLSTNTRSFTIKIARFYPCPQSLTLKRPKSRSTLATFSWKLRAQTSRKQRFAWPCSQRSSANTARVTGSIR